MPGAQNKSQIFGCLLPQTYANLHKFDTACNCVPFSKQVMTKQEPSSRAHFFEDMFVFTPRGHAVAAGPPGQKTTSTFYHQRTVPNQQSCIFRAFFVLLPISRNKKMKLTFCSEIFGCIFSLYFSRLLAQCPGGQLRQSPQEKLLHGNYIFSCSRWIWTSDRTVCCGWHGAVTWMARTTASVLAQGSANGVDRFGKDLGTVCRHSSEHGDELDGRNFIPKRDTVSTMNPETGSVGKFTRCYKPASNIVG